MQYQLSFNRIFPILLSLIIILWIYLNYKLMIADVWDETNFLLYFYSTPQTLFEKIKFIWTSSDLGNIYRPLPISLAILIIEPINNYELAWKVLRWTNVLLLLASLLFLLAALHKWGIKNYQKLIFSIFFLYSSAAIISASWFANMFDVSTVFFISLGIFLISLQQYIIAALVLSLSFFCKEISVLLIPFLFILVLNTKLDFRQFTRMCLIIVTIAGIYWYLRLSYIPLGSEQDIHGFSTIQLLPTLQAYFESFWWQTMKRDGMSLLGFIWLLVSLLALKGFINKAALIVLMMLSAIMYLGMFSYQNDVLMSHLNFVGRLYLVPMVLSLLMLIMWGRTSLFVILLMPVLWGAQQTYTNHRNFQIVYHQIYDLAQNSSDKLTIHYPEKPLNDHIRKIEIGDYPQACFSIGMKTLKYKQCK
ncbi:hypothetical protein [Candidatus Marithrix sp. Canyon 246]|uniref:hypothetical protein n=1 Tax=Candidatus Marithrix sp. Canyon 246 TaxID=1827136 RepID=UPI00084A1F9B|nr:hypothetical protein [Candidatus Marithrix sp. Canyon 246]